MFKVVPTITSGQVTLNFGGTNGGHLPNFVPFATILPYLLGDNGLAIAFLNLAGNIALLVPMGFLVHLVYPNMTWKKALGLGAACGFAIETIQSILRVGIFDIDDVILNMLGVIVGHWAFILLAKWVGERKYIHILISALLFIAAIAGSFYVIYPHGQQPVVPEVSVRGRFNNPSSEKEGEVPQQGDLCNGTGGTGQIINVEDNTITIKGKVGNGQIINLTDQTTIKNSSGSATVLDLKIGDRVTVVIDDSETASTVLVCNVLGSEIRSD